MLIVYKDIPAYCNPCAHVFFLHSNKRELIHHHPLLYFLMIPDQSCNQLRSKDFLNEKQINNKYLILYIISTYIIYKEINLKCIY
jgi:hypothetical protein